MNELPDDIKRAIGETIGRASICWQPKPHGIFDSNEAMKAQEALEKTILDWVNSLLTNSTSATEQ